MQKLTFNHTVDLTDENGTELPSDGFTQGAGGFWQVPNVEGLESNQIAELVAVIHDGSYTKQNRIATVDEIQYGTWRSEWELLIDFQERINQGATNNLDQNVAATGDAAEADFPRSVAFEEFDPAGRGLTVDFGTMAGQCGFRDGTNNVSGGGDTETVGSYTFNFRELAGRGPLLAGGDDGRYSFSIRWQDVDNSQLEMATHYRLYWDIWEFEQPELEDVFSRGTRAQ